jgi:hypothetical protein
MGFLLVNIYYHHISVMLWIDQKQLVITVITPRCRQFNLWISALAASRSISAAV